MKKSTTIRILLADDDEDDRDLFQQAINQNKDDISLEIFHNGKLLIDSLVNENDMPDIIFLDLNMPIMNGLEALRKLRRTKEHGHIFIAIYSTSSSSEHIEESYKSGATLYITKPSCFRKLSEALGNAIELYRQNR